jgi:hypothetical protein
MPQCLHRALLVTACLALAGTARADVFSTSAVNPTPVAASGLITGNYPATDGETSNYFAVDLKAGDLVTQMSFLGRADRGKMLEFDLKDPKGKMVGYYSIMSELDANQEASRIFPIDSSGRYLIVLKTKGPETTSLRVELGGSALPDRPAKQAAAAQLSTSYLAPASLPKDGVISGTFPGGEKQTTYYYFATNLKPGDLLTQISFAGRPNAPKMLELALLDRRARPDVNANYYIMGELNANDEKTRTFPIDSSGRYVLRVGVKGVEGTRFKVELGGSAYQVTN